MHFWRALLLATPLAALSASTHAAETAAPPNSIWPQTASDLPADPNVHFGTLANGMRYAILKNATPPGEVSFRLRIAAGSMDETPAERGLAHFLEHMAFRGSTHVPEGEVFHRMERLGAALGADTNASTGQSETVYRFDVPHADGESVDTALGLMRETASELLITPEATDSERKVVLSEERAGDTPARRAFKDQLAFFFKDQPIGDHLPIGDVGVVGTATAADIRAFYERWYRPERASLVVTGDIDPAAIEEKIKSRFSDWRGRGAGGVDPRLGPPLPRSFENSAHFEPGAQSQIAVVWTKPFRDGPDTRDYEREDTLRSLAVAALNQRLQDIAHSPNPPFVGSGASYREQARSATVTSLGLVTASPQALQGGLDATTHAYREALEQGFTQTEIDRQISVFRRAFDEAAAAADKRPTPALASGLVGKIDADEVFMHPADIRTLGEEVMRDLTADQVNGAFRRAFAGNGPLLFASGAEPVNDLDQVFSNALARRDDTAEVGKTNGKVEAWPYDAFGPEGQVTQQTAVPDLGVTEVGFANGVKLTVKPTNFRDDQVVVEISLGNGRSGIDNDKVPPIVAISSGGFLDGGLGKVSSIDIDRLLAARSVQSHFQIDDRFFRLGGTTRPQDLDVELQLLTAYVSDPGWRQEGLDLIREKIRTIRPQLENTPSAVFQRDGGALLRSGDKRWRFPSEDEIAATRLEDMQALLAPALASSPIEIAVVGNITVEQAVAAVARTLGSLPPRTGNDVIDSKNLRVMLPPGNRTAVRLTHHGRADQSVALTAWPAPDSLGDWLEVRNLEVLRAVLRQRLFDEFRTKIGGTYSPQVGSVSSLAFPGYGYFSAEAETPPDKIAIFNDTLKAIVADLQNRDVDADEFERARKPLIETIRKEQQTNGYWASWLVRAQSDSRQLERLRSLIPELEAVTPASLRDVARKWLKDENAWHLEILPEGTK